jgi:predicted lysophospholipase L1 biosynthesis ABC-type transport system permease subunit
MTIVGVAAFPRLNRGSFSTLGLGTGAITRAEAFPPYNSDVSEAPPGIDPEDFVGPGGATYEFVTIKARPEATAEERREIVATAREIGDANLQMVRTEQRPIAIDNYADVRSTPVVLAVVLGSMAAATLAHLVVSVVRRRRRDLAVCAALGMQRRQLASAVVVQALLVVGVAVLVGVPLGLAGGRVAWSGFAADLGVIETLRLPLFTVALAVLVVVVVSVAVAAVPAVAAAQMRPAAVLRDE